VSVLKLEEISLKYRHLNVFWPVPVDEVAYTHNRTLQKGINLARNALNKDLQNTQGADDDLETSTASIASSASNPVPGQSQPIPFVPKQQLLQILSGLHLQILCHQCEFTWVRMSE